MIKKEIWKDIKDYEGLYQVSNLGRIKSLAKPDFNGKTKDSFIMKLDTHSPYTSIQLSKKGKSKYFLVHRLVALAFIPDYFEGAVINHKDENKRNNNADNLEWCTVQHNNRYGSRSFNISEANSTPVVGINVQTGSQIFLKSMTEAEGLGFSSAHISYCASGKIKIHGGYKWKKLNKDTYFEQINKTID